MKERAGEPRLLLRCLWEHVRSPAGVRCGGGVGTAGAPLLSLSRRGKGRVEAEPGVGAGTPFPISPPAPLLRGPAPPPKKKN